jgi:osmotically-inducible protein OsmY
MALSPRTEGLRMVRGERNGRIRSTAHQGRNPPDFRLAGAGRQSLAVTRAAREQMMRPDRDIQQDVEAELRWVPDVDESNISVSVAEGVVTLHGVVPHFLDRFHAENAARRVIGCAAVVNDVHVRRKAGECPTDGEIARAAIDAIAVDMPAVAGSVQVIVSDGHVKLEGCVDGQWQASRIESTVRAIRGVTVVANLIRIRPHAAPTDIKQRIEAAFRRSAEVDAGRIHVESRDDTIYLSGTVHSLHEKGEAERTAWSAPGVAGVVNALAVVP